MPAQKRSDASRAEQGKRKGMRAEIDVQPQRIRESSSSSCEEGLKGAAVAAAIEEDEEVYSTTDEESEGGEEDSFSDFFGEDGEQDDDEDDSDMSDDSSVKTNIAVNFDARAMFTRHVDGISGMIDNTIPDGENLVDRRDFGLALKAAHCTTLITVTQIEEDDASDVSVNTADPMDDEDVYGVASLVHVGSLAATFPSCAGIIKLFSSPPESHVVAEGTAPTRLLKGADSRAVIFFNDHLNVVPPHVVAQVHDSLLQEFNAFAAGNAVAKAVQHVVMLARVQRLTGGDAAAEKAGKAKTAPPAAVGGLDLRNYEFLRWEDEVYYRFADSRMSVPVFKFPRYIESQAEADVPRCVVFALPLAKMAEAIKVVTATAQRLATSSARSA